MFGLNYKNTGDSMLPILKQAAWRIKSHRKVQLYVCLYCGASIVGRISLRYLLTYSSQKQFHIIDAPFKRAIDSALRKSACWRSSGVIAYGISKGVMEQPGDVPAQKSSWRAVPSTSARLCQRWAGIQ